MGSVVFDNLHRPAALHERRERVFLVLAGLFLGAMTMLNILGITRFIHLGPLALAVGVLPYPMTFLCTDFISEFYGRRRANFVVWVGFVLNLFVLGFLYLGHQIPGIDEQVRPLWLPEGSWVAPPWQTLTFDKALSLPFGEPVRSIDLFEVMYRCTRSAVFASMVAYLAAQFCDVYLFHFWKRLTGGRHLWLRNNGSTLISQMVDSVAVVFITFWAPFMAGERTWMTMWVLVVSSYLFKMVVALLDTIPFYIGVRLLTPYLRIDPTRDHDADREEARLAVADTARAAEPGDVAGAGNVADPVDTADETGDSAP